MKKHIVFVCRGNQQFGIVVKDTSVYKVIEDVINDLESSGKQFIRLTDYSDSNQELWVRTDEVIAIVVADVGNIQVPSQRVLVPRGN